MNFDNLLSDDAVLAELGRRIAEERLARDMTQAWLAEAAGVAKRTVERLEGGESIQLGNLIRCLRRLDKLDGLERLLPPTPVNPLELLARRRRRRFRARGGGVARTTRPWTWGDET